MQLASRSSVKTRAASRHRADRRILCAAFVVAGSSLLMNTQLTHAQVTKTWITADSGGASKFWNDASAWTGFSIPDAITTNINFYPDTSTLIGNVRSTNNAGAVNTYSALSAITINGQGTNSGTSTLTLDGTGITYANPASLTFNSLNGSGGGLTVNYNIVTTYNAASTIDATNATAQVNYGSQLLGSGALSITGPSNGNTLLLTSGNTGRLANTTITGGIVEARGGTNNFFANSISNFVRVQSGARLVINPQSTAATNSATLIINGTGPDTNGALQFTNVGSGSYNFLGLIVETNATLNISGSNTLTLNNFGGATGISGSGTLTKTGSGNLNILQASAATSVGGSFGAFSGNLNWTGGVLQLPAASNALGSNASATQWVSVASTGGLIVTGSGVTQPQSFAITGTGVGSAVGAIAKTGTGTVTLGSVALTGAASIDVASGGQITVGSSLSGSSTLTKTGGGTLFVGVANPFTGNINVNAGTLQISASNSLGSTNSTVTVASGAVLLANNLFNNKSWPQTFVLNGTGTGSGAMVVQNMDNFNVNTTISGLTVQSDSTILLSRNGTGANLNTGLRVTGLLAGSGTLTKNGDAILYIETASGTFTGNLAVNGGAVQLSGVNYPMGSNASGTQWVSVASTGSYIVNGAGLAPQAVAISGTGTGTNQAIGAIAKIGSGTYTLGAVSLSAAASIDVVSGGTLAIAGLGSGSATLTKTNTGALNINGGANSPFTGNININAGTLNLGGAHSVLGTVSTQTVTVASGAALQANWSAAYNIPQTIAINGTGVSGNGALYIQNVNFGDFTIGGINVVTDSTINIFRQGAGLRTAVLTRGFSGSGNLIKNGDIIISIPNSAQNSTFTGNLTVNAGRIVANAGGGSGVNILGNGNGGLQTVTIAPNAQVVFNQGNGSYTQPQNFTVNSDGTFSQIGGLVFTGVNFGGGPSIGSLGSTTGGSVYLDQDPSAGVSGAIAVTPTRGLYGAGKITKYGTARLAINQTGSFTGDILVATGIVSLSGGKANVLGDNTSGTQTVSVAASGQILLDQGNAAYSQPQTFLINGTGTGSLTGALVVNNLNFGNTTLGGINVASDATIAVNLNATPNGVYGANLTNPLAGSGKLTKIGNGTLNLLSGSSAFTGDVLIAGGTVTTAGQKINFFGPNASGTQTVSIAASGQLVINQGNGAYSQPQIFSIAGTGTGSVTGALVINGVNFSNMSIGGLNLTSAATVNIIRDGTANSPFGANVTRALSGSGDLTKVGNGGLYLAGAGSSYAGNITVAGGTLGVNAVGAIASVPSVTLQDGTTLSIGASQQIGASVTYSGGNVSVAATNGTYAVLTGPTSGSGALSKTGPGTVSYTGNSTATGAVTVSTGALSIGNGGATGSIGSGDVTVNSGAALILNRSGTTTVSNNISSSGGFIVAVGGGTTTLAGSLAGFNGSYQVSGAGTKLITNQPLTPATGSLVVAGAGASFNLNVTVPSSGYTNLGTVGSIVAAPGAAVRVGTTARTASNAGVLITSSVDLSGDTGLLDLGNNDMIVQGVGATGYDSLSASVAAFLANPASGLGTTAGEAYRTLAVFLNDTGDGTPYFTTYDGVPVSASDVIVKYTYVGDTNLDGKLDGIDYRRVMEGRIFGLSGWSWGDVDYSGGTVNDADLATFVQAYNSADRTNTYGDGQGTSGGTSSIPEPAMAAPLCVALTAVSRRRRR
jgi:autotransporter-associated beta strand protein